MAYKLITQDQIEQRKHWIEKINTLSGDFGVDADRVETEIQSEINNLGLSSLLGHLRLCGAIPENYNQNSSEEKLYSKYTDIIIHEAYKAIGLTSIVLETRSDSADVECVANHYSFVADAKAFRLSRTAKNQKDFKLSAVETWKRGKPYAMVVCPVYQLPKRASQIYQQASQYSVCIATYSHLSVLVRYSQATSNDNAINLLQQMFITIESINPSKDAISYWQALNRTMINFDQKISNIWQQEKIASVESVNISKEEALNFYASQRERIMRLDRKQAIDELLRINKIEGKIEAINSVKDKGLLGMF